MIEELKDMLRIVFDDFDNLLEPNAMNILVEHLDSRTTEDACRLLQFVRCHELLLIQPNRGIVMEAGVDVACVAIFTRFRTQTLHRVPGVRAPADSINSLFVHT